MSRKKYKEKNDNESEGSTLSNIRRSLKEETVQGVLAIAFLALSVLLVLSAFNQAGRVGEKIHDVFKLLLGVGYFLLPVLLFLLSISFFQSLRKKFSIIQVIGAFLFFLSGLGTIDLLFRDEGGVLGHLVSSPLIKLFDSFASGLLLIALLVISFLITFDTALKIDFSFIKEKIFKKKEKELEINDGENSDPENNTPKKEEISPASDDSKKPEEEESTLKKVISSLSGKEKDDTSDSMFSVRPATFLQKPFVPPPLSLLERDKGKPGVGDIKANANIIKRTLQNFGINVEMDEISIGPSVTRYSLKPAEGVKLSRIVGLQNDLSLALAAHPIRIEAPIPGKSLVGIEIPNTVKTTVGLGTILAADEFQNSEKALLVSLGKVISGKPQFANLAKMPHLLIAGATGSGKSVTIHAVITSLLYRNSPENLKFIMIDPKRVELTLYNKIPHLLTPVITDAKKTILALKWAAKEMDRRYDILETESVRDIESYHKNILEPELKKLQNASKDDLNEGKKLPETMPYIVIVIDELADIMATYPRELEASIVRLAQMSRAVGIHLMLSTQRPSVNVITGLIKANIPARIALQVSSQIDSRTILDTGGAEKLLGAGDMLYLSGEMSKPQRIQSAFISESELKNVVKYLADNYKDEIPSEIDFSESAKNAIFESDFGDQSDSGDEDDLYEEAREIVMQAGKASTSYLQRKLRIGYARAARLIDMLEEKGVVSAGSGAKPREVLGSQQTEGFGQSEEEI